MNGSTVFTGIKSVELLVAVKFLYNGDRCQQRFELSANKPTLRYTHDKRYEIYDKLNNKISEVMLSNLNGDTFSFFEKIEEENVITIVYDVHGKIIKSLLVNYFFVVPSFLPAYTGCTYCVYSKKDDKKIYCDFKKQSLEKELHRCAFFKQCNLFKT